MTDDRHDVTRLLRDWHAGDVEALDRLVPMVVGELRRIAKAFFAKEAPGHTLQPTALVNEAYLRLVDAGRVDWQGREQFFRIAARLMRCVLVDHARGRDAAKRGGDVQHTAVDLDQIAPAAPEIDVIALDAALEAMQRINPEGCRIVEMRYFTGLNLEEIADVLDVSRTTVKRRWRTARIWLQRELSRAGGSPLAPAGG
jgi:RNA polymerase sigma factor (TIGR02999 family)